MVELKDSESEVDYDSESNIEGGKHIINAEPNATVATTKSDQANQKNQRKENVSFTRRCG
jgi:hypothetical protein